MIKNIIFDLGNVLFKLRFENSIEKYTKNEEEIELLTKAIFKSEEWIKLDEGTIKKEEAIKTMNGRLPEYLQPICEKIMEYPVKDIITINDNVLEFIKQIRERGYKTYILSNAPLEIRKYLENQKLLKYFDGEIISAEEKILKPNHKIYKLLLDRFSLKAEESLFLDDREENIQAAKECCINGYVFDYNKFDEFLEEMKKYKI